MLIPGRVVARIAAIGITAAIPFLRELALPFPLAVGWIALWLGIAVLAGRPETARPPSRERRTAGVEPGTVGLLVGGALLAVMLAALARQGLPAEPTRGATLGMTLLGLGLVHLMVRRHALRAVVAFGAFGLGLELLESQARATDLGGGTAGPLPLVATAVAVALTARIAAGRMALTGSAWVSDAHDLHDGA